MNRQETVEFLRKNPVFWSRLGFCYDPTRYHEDGRIIVFGDNFEDYTKTHDAFSDAGVKIHTCILQSGWVGVDKYDYSLCDSVLQSLFASGKAEYYIPRIKLNPPIEWCAANPTEVLVYENGPTTAEEIKALVNTPLHDILGYNAPNGYYNANGWQDDRPNVGGVISLQSFSSKKWLADAGEALSRLIDHIENSPYGEKIIAYHIAFGTSGEAMLWGRSREVFGDYGIFNKQHFLNWGAKKYGSLEEAFKMWGEDSKEQIIPPPHLRENLENYYKDEEKDRWSIDYDLYMGDVTTDAILHFCDIVHEKTDKAAGTFYGYILHMSRTAYTGHLAFKRLLESGRVDFFAAPKSYRRSSPGEPGGEMAPTVSINRTCLWLDECDNRTHLSSDIIGGVAANAEETYAVQLRELCKNLSHNSGLWFMDLGGNWYDDDGIMENIGKIAQLGKKITAKEYRSVAEIALIVDEYAVLKTHPNRTFDTEEFIRELQLCGAPIDIIFAHDTENIDLSKIKLAVLLTPRFVKNEEANALKEKMAKGGKLLFVGETEADTSQDFTAKETDNYKTIRKIVEAAGVKTFAPENCTVYADNRIISFFPREDMTISLEEGLVDAFSGEKAGDSITLKAKSGKAFIKA